MEYNDLDHEFDSDDSKKECDNCQGSGVTDCPMEYDGECPEQCPACDGRQRVSCNECDGIGWQEQY